MERLHAQLNQGLETPKPFNAKIGNIIYTLHVMKRFYDIDFGVFLSCVINSFSFDFC
jgi:hypothetical protein